MIVHNTWPETTIYLQFTQTDKVIKIPKKDAAKVEKTWKRQSVNNPQLNNVIDLRHWIQPILIFIYFVFLFVITPLIVYNTVKDGFENKDQLILIGSLFVGCALPISIFHFSQHLKHFNQPVLQVCLNYVLCREAKRVTKFCYLLETYHSNYHDDPCLLFGRTVRIDLP